MAADHFDLPAGAASSVADSNGTLESSETLGRTIVVLRARCSNLRHWCRALLDDPVSAGVLDDAAAAELRHTSPEVTDAEGQTVLALLARGGNVPPTHPLSPTTNGSIGFTAGTGGGIADRFLNPTQLRAMATELTAEHERLRQAFFALYDHLHPGDDLTDEYFLALQSQGPLRSMSEVLAEIEREFGESP